MSPRPLFPPLSPEARGLLARLDSALDAAAPLKPKHRADLPEAVAELSRSLTNERGCLPRGYMSDPRLLSAYLRYFLPWNVFRQARLFSGLELELAEDATIADLGAGPLTSVLALWLARPDLRERGLTFVCLDRSLKAVRAGVAVRERLLGTTPWRIVPVKGGVETPLRRPADLVVLANALNEFGWSGREDDAERAERLAKSLCRPLAAQGRLLVIEPGVRLAARALAVLRSALIARGLSALCPCPHQGECPMPGLGKAAWCHFNFDVEGAPDWLAGLSRAAGLAKRSASLSFVLFGREGERQAGVPLARAVSEPFPVEAGRGQYACSERGLALLVYGPGARPPQPGDAVPAVWPDAPRRDAKSGALILPLPGDEKGRARR